MTLKQFSVAIEPIVWFWGRGSERSIKNGKKWENWERYERSITRPSMTWMEKRPSHAVLLGAYLVHWIPAFMFARVTQVLKCDSVAFLPHWRSSGHRRSWPQHARCWKAMATHSLCLLWSHESGPQSLNINMNIRKAKLKTHTMKCNSLLPAKVACGADLKQSWNDMKLHEMTWNDISNSQATHIKQSKNVKTSQARTCSME